MAIGENREAPNSLGLRPYMAAPTLRALGHRVSERAGDSETQRAKKEADKVLLAGLSCRSKCRRRHRLAWKIRALTAATVKPRCRAVSWLLSPRNSRSRTTARRFLRRLETARVRASRSSFAAAVCSGDGAPSTNSKEPTVSASSWTTSDRGVCARR